MNSKNKETGRVHIIGAGISGLTAAIELEKKGYKPIIIEADKQHGGRVQTDWIDDYPYDRGFQVLLTAYPALGRYVDLSALNLEYFYPGAIVIKNGKEHTIGDPLRYFPFIKSVFDNSIANITDKIKTLKLSQKLKRKSLESIFSSGHHSTLDYLKEVGFSRSVIEHFYRPFFGGIFLESELLTSSRMFEFVFKMFAQGYAAIPANGIQAISDQLKNSLCQTEFMMNTAVVKVEDGHIILKDRSIKSDRTIIATEPCNLLQGSQKIEWKSCYNFFYYVTTRNKHSRMIYLNADASQWVNNFHYPTDLHPHPHGKTVLSATIIKESTLSLSQLESKVREELTALTGNTDLIPVTAYHIPKALPNVAEPHYAVHSSASRFSKTIFLAGDHYSSGSLNSAMESGKVAADLLINAE